MMAQISYASCLGVCVCVCVWICKRSAVAYCKINHGDGPRLPPMAVSGSTTAITLIKTGRPNPGPILSRFSQPTKQGGPAAGRGTHVALGYQDNNEKIPLLGKAF